MEFGSTFWSLCNPSFGGAAQLKYWSGSMPLGTSTLVFLAAGTGFSRIKLIMCPANDEVLSVKVLCTSIEHLLQQGSER